MEIIVALLRPARQPQPVVLALLPGVVEAHLWYVGEIQIPDSEESGARGAGGCTWGCGRRECCSC